MCHVCVLIQRVRAADSQIPKGHPRKPLFEALRHVVSLASTVVGLSATHDLSRQMMAIRALAALEMEDDKELTDCGRSFSYFLQDRRVGEWTPLREAFTIKLAEAIGQPVGV